MGPVLFWNFSVLLSKQGEPGPVVGSKKGQSQNHDLSEDGPGTEELLPHRGDPQSEKKAHLSL